MATYVALLYSIVLGPGRRVVMADLKDLATEVGLAKPRTVLATGNLVFAAARTTPRKLEAKIEPAFASRFGRHIDIIVRSADAWHATITANPFPDAATSDPSHLITRVMREPVAETVIDTLAPYAVEGERMAVAGGDLWIHFPHGIGPSKLSAAITPKRAGIGTARNWNTMRKITDLIG